MTFYYPQEWDGKVEESRSISGQTVTVTFQTDISGQKVVLFSVVMGPGVVDGYLLGQLEDPEEGTINVYSVMNEIDPEDWSEENIDQDIVKMKECGFNVVRIAEFSWKKMEPSEGCYS